jgi:hypothetical protein
VILTSSSERQLRNHEGQWRPSSLIWAWVAMDLAEDLPSLESEVRECFVDDKGAAPQG